MKACLDAVAAKAHNDGSYYYRVLSNRDKIDVEESLLSSLRTKGTIISLEDEKLRDSRSDLRPEEYRFQHRRVLCDWCAEPISPSEDVHLLAIRGREYLVHCLCGQIVIESHVQSGGSLRIQMEQASVLNPC